MLLHCTAEYRIFPRSLSFACYFASCHRSHFQPLDCFECTGKFSFIMAPADVRPPHASRSPSTEQTSATETYFLPDNPPPHLTPSLTHQPELLFTQGFLDSLANAVTQIPNHPMIDSPIPDHTLFTDADAFRLYFQYHQSATELARITMRLKRASRLLEFIAGPPRHPGSYRVNPLAHFPPDTTDFLADEVRTFCPPPSRHHPSSAQSPSPACTLWPRSKGPLTVQRQLRILAASSTSTGVSRSVYTFHITNWTLSAQKMEHRTLLLFQQFPFPHCSLPTSPKVLINLTFTTRQLPQPFFVEIAR